MNRQIAAEMWDSVAPERRRHPALVGRASGGLAEDR